MRANGGSPGSLRATLRKLIENYDITQAGLDGFLTRWLGEERPRFPGRIHYSAAIEGTRAQIVVGLEREG